MSATSQQTEAADGAGQNLPTQVAAADSSQPAAHDRKGSVPAVERTPGAALPAAESLGAPGTPAVGSEPSAHGTEALPAGSPAEAVHRAIENTTVGLQRLEATSVSMVLKPDAQTQLSLHVKWQQGHFEALAVLERGDVNALGAHWSQLQHRLAEQGVRLAPLVSTAGQGAQFSGGQFASPKQQREPALAGEAVIAKPTPSKTSNSTRRPTAAANGREWWA